MATWTDLDRELRIWQDAGHVPTFWWRDDDTERPTPALDRLIGLAEGAGVPLHLAVVPAGVAPDLAARLARAQDVHVMQHGLAHINHEPPGARASEVGQNRDTALQLCDLADGWQRLVAAGLPNLLPAFAPPWNRIALTTLPHLPGLGYRLLSAFDATVPQAHVPGLVQINVQCDPIRWKDGARFRGTDTTLHILLEHLRQRRRGDVPRDEPTGLVTHHLQTDEATWDFTQRLLAHLTQPGQTRWLRLSSFMESG